MDIRRILALCIIVIVATACPRTKPPEANGAYTPVNRAGSAAPDNDPVIAQAQNVVLNLNVFDPAAQQITLPLFDGVTVTATRDRTSTSQYGTMWTGALSNVPGGRLMFVRRGDIVVADIFAGRSTYQIRYRGDGVHSIRKLDPRKFLPEADPTPVNAKNNPEQDTCTSDPPSEIDAMIVYTDDARAAAGGNDAMEAEVFLALEAANQAYINSNISQRLRLVYTGEVTYTETGNVTTDRDALKNPSDGIIDNVHTLRNAHAADIVAMITQTSSACGQSFIMTTVGNTMESSAFGAVKRSCSATNFSYAHEMAHIMAARHDWPTDPTANIPYAYNHGFFNAAPTAPGTPWRTVMSYDNSTCAAAGGCTRVQYFSNPNVNFPAGGDPMGSTTGQQADNHLVLNNTALTVANFRCSSPSAPNVWMKDTWNDTGLEPDPATAAEDMWKSPYIWIRNSQDTTLTAQHMHENPIAGATNWVYVKMQNGGSAAASGNLELYFANANVSLTWPGGWTLLTSIPVSGFAAHSSHIVEAQWPSTPGPGHFCMVARWVSAADPMTTPEGADIGANTRNNNNIVWRNLNIVSSGDEDSFFIDNPTRNRLVSTIVFRAPKDAPNFLETGSLEVRLDPKLLGIWSGKGSGFTRDGDVLRITGAKTASIEGVVLPPAFRAAVSVRFKPLATTPRTTFYVDAVHVTSADNKAGARDIGGVSWEVHTELNYKPGTTVQQR